MYRANIKVVALSFNSEIAQDKHINKKAYKQPNLEIFNLAEKDILTNPSSWGMTNGGEGNDDFGDGYDDIS